MQHLSILLCCFTFIYAGNSDGQEIDAYQWENRILIVKTEGSESELYLTQLEELRSQEQGLAERKLLIYQVKGQYYRKGLKDDGEWRIINNKRLLTISNKSNSNFEVILIGLDGGIKLRRSEVLPTNELFAIIDGMPMRRRELRIGEK